MGNLRIRPQRNGFSANPLRGEGVTGTVRAPREQLSIAAARKPLIELSRAVSPVKKDTDQKNEEELDPFLSAATGPKTRDAVVWHSPLREDMMGPNVILTQDYNSSVAVGLFPPPLFLGLSVLIYTNKSFFKIFYKQKRKFKK